MGLFCWGYSSALQSRVNQAWTSEAVSGNHRVWDSDQDYAPERANPGTSDSNRTTQAESIKLIKQPWMGNGDCQNQRAKRQQSRTACKLQTTSHYLEGKQEWGKAAKIGLSWQDMGQQGKSENREVKRYLAAGDELKRPKPRLRVEYLKIREVTHSPVPGQASRPTARTQVFHLTGTDYVFRVLPHGKSTRNCF